MTAARSERAIQRGILAMAGLCFPDVLLCHVPNGGHLAGGKRERAMQMGALKGDGLKVGFPDLIALWNRGAALIEVKALKGRLSPEQNAMHDKLQRLSWTVHVVRSEQEAFDALVMAGARPVREWAG